MKKKGFTLIELIGVLVVIAIITLIATPLVMNIIRNSKESARKRSIDNYGKAIELAITSYLLDNGKFPTEVSQLNIEYSGSKVECGVEYINDDNSIYLEGCKVNDRLVENYTYGKDERPAALQLISKSNSINITNYNDGNKGEMYTFDHDATEQTPALIDYRYIGNVPNNYVSFNNGETWRIIGVYDTDDGTGKYEKRIKLIRDESLGNKPWNSNNKNEWTIATLNIYLNGEYYNELSGDVKSMIKNTKYYLGGLSSYSNGEEYYRNERGETVYSENYSYWNGLLALMYPSDYMFTYSLGVDNMCYTNGYDCGDSSGKANSWIYNSKSSWFLTSNSTSQYYSAGVIWNGSVRFNSSFSVSSSYAFRPVLYLKPEVKIKQGDGTIDNPYIFEL